jgi:hypothetical protein
MYIYEKWQKAKLRGKQTGMIRDVTEQLEDQFKLLRNRCSTLCNQSRKETNVRKNGQRELSENGSPIRALKRMNVKDRAPQPPLGA